MGEDVIEFHVRKALGFVDDFRSVVDREAERRGRTWQADEVCAEFRVGGRTIEVTYGDLVANSGAKMALDRYLLAWKSDFMKQQRGRVLEESARLMKMSRQMCPLCALENPLDFELNAHQVMVERMLRSEVCLAMPWRRAARHLAQLNLG